MTAKSHSSPTGGGPTGEAGDGGRPGQMWVAAGPGFGLLVAPGASLAGILDPAGPVGRADKLILLDSLSIMLAIVIPVILATLGFAWWFRASNTRARYLPTWSYSGRLELIIWSIPLMVVLFLGGVGWVGAHDLDPAKPLPSSVKPLEVEVVSLDWKWLFIYPDQGVASVNQLVVPAGTPIHFRLTSATVMNSFFVPRLGSQIYTMAGMTTQLNLKADAPGVYPGLSAQFSGAGFSEMRFQCRRRAPGQFSQLGRRHPRRKRAARRPSLRTAAETEPGQPGGDLRRRAGRNVRDDRHAERAWIDGSAGRRRRRPAGGYASSHEGLTCSAN